MAHLDYFIDFKAPAAYLSLDPTLELAAELSLELRWHPYRTQQKPVPLAHEQETKGETHVRVRALARQQTHLKYASLRGLPMHFAEQPGNTDLALAALLFAQQQQQTEVDPSAYARGAFHAYWVDNFDLNDRRLVRRLLQDSGYNAEDFDAQHYLTELEAKQIPAEERGVVDAPAYVINAEVFIGREHLPLMRERLMRERLSGIKTP